MARETLSPNNQSTLHENLQAGRVRPLYLFYGEERYLLDRALERLREAVVAEGLDVFNYERLDGKVLTLEKLADAVESVPVMSEKRLVAVYDYDLYHAEESARGKLADLFSALPEQVCLVFVYDSLAYKEDKRVKLHGVLEKCALAVRFDKTAGHALESFLREQFQSYGKSVSLADLGYMIHRCGDLMGPLAGEVNKIALYAKNERVTRGDIDAVSTQVLGAVVFDLTRALFERRNQEAMEILQELSQEEPIAILGAVGKNLRELYAARLSLERGLGEREVMAITGCREYPARLHLRAARRFPLAWCRRAVILCARADRQLKTGAKDRDRVLEWLLAMLAAAGEKPV